MRVATYNGHIHPKEAKQHWTIQNIREATEGVIGVLHVRDELL
jgi:hypothetical protein